MVCNSFTLNYGMINFACFAASTAHTPGWRPTFKYYNRWVSLFGCILCIITMFIINWGYSLINCSVTAAIYGYLYFTDPKVSWGPATDGILESTTVHNLIQMRSVKHHAKTFRPHLLVLSDDFHSDLSIFRMMNIIRSKAQGLLVISKILHGYLHKHYKRYLDFEDDYLKKEGLKGCVVQIIAPSTRQGVQVLYQCLGLDKLTPNVIVFPYLEDWRKESENKVDEWRNIIRDCFECNKSAMIPRHLDKIPWEKQKFEGRIDIWWLVDDGGLTLLIPYLINTKTAWNSCKLRVITTPDNIDDSPKITIYMARLLSQLRINAEVEIAIPNFQKDFTPFIPKLEKKLNLKFDEHELDRTKRYIMLRELLEELSSDATLIFFSMPLPHAKIKSSTWFAWLELLSVKLPPMIFIRGNNLNVITIKS